MVKELSHDEMQNIKGGFWQFVVGAIAGGMLYDLVFHTEDVIESCGKGRNDAKKMWSR